MLTSDKMNTTACFHIILQQDNKKYLYNLNMVAKKLFEFLCSEKGPFSCGGADVVTDQMEDEIMKGQSFPG